MTFDEKKRFVVTLAAGPNGTDHASGGDFVAQASLYESRAFLKGATDFFGVNEPIAKTSVCTSRSGDRAAAYALSELATMFERGQIR